MSREVGGGRHVVVGERESLVVVEGQMEAEGGLVGVVQPADVVTNLRNGPNDVSRVVWGCCCHGPALAFVGRRWVLWACVGLRWLSLGAVGLC